MSLDGALCRGLHLAPLFESTDAGNHAEAAAICGAGTATECPAIAACRELSMQVYLPVGTWAGVLFGASSPGLDTSLPMRRGGRKNGRRETTNASRPWAIGALTPAQGLADRLETTDS